jgi:dienelactone hydrolase
MTTIATKPVRQWQWPPQPATALLIGWMFALVTASGCTAVISTAASPEGPAQTAYAPANQPGPIVIVISGNLGPALEQDYASEIARLGYYAVVLDGRDILTPGQDGAVNLRKAIDRAQRSPHAVPGKTAVIGFSRGGGGALVHASEMRELVSVVVAYYPTTSSAKNPGSFVKRFQVPVLVLAGERDQNDWCPIECMRAMEVAAKESGAKFELVVYPGADHGFNRNGPAYRHDAERDAWRRTTEMLRLHHPLR